ncbi:Down syndrome cell adhesion molecule [Mizuhopecten yessoensis]|uniref:Down syndrome cell adhesion molecule n=1 Tax=Mizuhopecten yessoensis TaxID=6573 RepID=A0A210PR11_MIZYE|nr:Down syndrome cell adhesion molecule [Mizuhopecten yessoensis]
MNMEENNVRMMLRMFAAMVLLVLTPASQGRTTESPLDNLRGPIFISEPPSSLTFGNTKGAAVPCTAFGRPAPTLDWIKEDGTAVEDIPDILEILPNNTLYFHPFDATDFIADVHTHTYRCVASNDAGIIISRDMDVKAVLVDEYTTYHLTSNEVWAMRGSTAVFRCSINPYFVKDYVKIVGWVQGTNPIVEDERISLLYDGELHIRDIRDADQFTTYRCVARNTLTGEEKSSSYAYLTVHDPPVGWMAPTMDDVSRTVKVKEGEAVEIPCVASSNPLPKYRWHMNSPTTSVVIDNTHFVQKGGNLVVNTATVRDSGHFICNASNEHGSATAVTELIVTSPLITYIDPPTQMIDSGQTAVFNCTVSGYPITSITWYKNGELLVADDRISIQSDTVLEIVDISRQDQGMYQCIVTNDEASSQGTSQLLLGSAHPSFIDTFVDQFVLNGQRTSLRCTAAGNPTPRVTWTLDGAAIPDDPNVHAGSSMDSLGIVVSYVNISSVQITFGGEYTCTASNDVGTISYTGRINVYGIPYVRKMQNLTATAGEPLSIRCYVAGYPVKSIKWSKGGFVLPRNHLQDVVNGTLTIKKVQKYQDIGQYTCTAKNGDGQGNGSSLFITVLEPPKIDSFNFPRKKQGDRVVVSCVVSSGDQPLEIKWTKDGEEIPPDMGITITTVGSYSSMLSIGDVSPTHNGNYTCQAQNDAAGVNFTAPLHVDVPPRWIIEPEDSFVILKGTVALDCLTAGTPSPYIMWMKAAGTKPGNYMALEYLKDDAENATDRMQLLSNGTLIIRESEESDHGYYLCHADNRVGVGLSKVIFLTVHIPARFDSHMKNYTVRRDHNITMDCQAIGDKPLAVTWSFNGQQLSTLPNPRRDMKTVSTTRGKLSTLALHPTLREDTGFYVCFAKNKFGNGVQSMRLTVLEPPEPPANLTLVKVMSRNLTVSWSQPYNGNTPLLYYSIEYINSSGVWQGVLPNVTVESKFLTATLTDLHPAYVFYVRVRANNSVGFGLPSEQISVAMDEERPSGPPQKIQIKAIGSEALKILWMPPKKSERNGVIKGYYIGYKETSSPSRFIYITKAVEGEFEPVLDIHNLEKFTEYTVHIKAYNDMGQGPKSVDYSVFTLEDVPSQPPQGVQANAINSQAIKVIWSPPPLFTLHGILQGYRILYKPVRKDEDESDANIETSSKLEVTISNLQKYTNYSIQVLAYTRKGEGVRSDPIYVRTQEDVPERPANIKVLPVNSSSVLVAWKPPHHSNGLLNKYTLYVRNGSDTSQDAALDVTPTLTTYLMSELPVNMDVFVQVSATTRIGEGERTHVAKASPLDKVAARIASFSDVLTIPWQHPVTLPCMVVGDPAPKVKWMMRGGEVVVNDRIQVLQNGSLYITSVVGGDAANYTCTAENVFGSDSIVFAISVQAPPKPPKLFIAATTSSTIQVNWRSSSNGGSPIQGFELNYKKEFEAWRKMKLGALNRTYTASALLCGTVYRFYISAFNRLGTSISSVQLTVQTNGSTPIMPPQSKLLRSINTTSVDLDMTSWKTAGCPIRFYSVKYQVWGDDEVVEVSNSVNRNTSSFTVQDLHPATWYMMVVTAHSDAGSTESHLKFATLTYHGSTIMPIYVARKMETRFYEKAHIIIPLCAGIVALCVMTVGILLYCRRRREMHHIKENASNLRRDITAETSLMNDLDKRLNLDLDSSSGNSEPFGKRNVNLLISLNSDDNLTGNSHTWFGLHDNSKTNSDNGSFDRSGTDEDGNINPYATFNQLKQVLVEKNDMGRNDDMMLPEFDDISLEKAQAQKCMSTPSEPYVPFFHKAEHEARDPNPPLVPMRDQSAKQAGYDNQGLILSPRKYASAEQIHALFTQCPPRPHSTYGKSKSGSHGSSDEKGSQRHSVISSVTTVSSSRDELLEALENARKNPPPPVVYESPQDSSSGPTDSSVATEPGIVQFTQSPPKPNEQRQAACEVPGYECAQGKPKRSMKKEAESDTTDRETTDAPRETFHPRRTRGRHRGKQRGTIAKRQIIPAFVPRTHSRTSTTSSEEVTYTFGGRDSPHSISPLDGAYQSYRKAAEKHKKGMRTVGRSTPHVRTRYDTALATPGTDEHRPLVMSLAGQSMTSPAEEDEDAVSLLDRYYRPVPDDDEIADSSSAQRKNKGDKGYTEDFTIV